MRQMAGVAIIDALRSARRRNRIALAVEHTEGVAVFEDERLQFRERDGGRDGKRIGVAGLLLRSRPLDGLNAFLSCLVSMHEVDPGWKWDATPPSPSFSDTGRESRPQVGSSLFGLLVRVSESGSSDRQA